MPRIIKVATEQIEKQPSETTTSSISEKEITTQPPIQTSVQTVHLQKPDAHSLNGDEENSTAAAAVANPSNTAVSEDDQKSSSPQENVSICFEFAPSQEWVNRFQSTLDLTVIQAMLAILGPQVTCVYNMCVCVCVFVGDVW